MNHLKILTTFSLDHCEVLLMSKPSYPFSKVKIPKPHERWLNLIFFLCLLDFPSKTFVFVTSISPHHLCPLFSISPSGPFQPSTALWRRVFSGCSSGSLATPRVRSFSAPWSTTSVVYGSWSAASAATAGSTTTRPWAWPCLAGWLGARSCRPSFSTCHGDSIEERNQSRWKRRAETEWLVRPVQGSCSRTTVTHKRKMRTLMAKKL